jgi:hypothetical protein
MKKILVLLAFLPGMIQAQEGYVNFTTFGFLSGASTNRRQAPLSFISEHHGMVGKCFSAGLMTGIEQLNENVLPLALSLRLYQPGNSKLFLGGYMGYSVSLEKPFNEYGGVVYKKAKGGFVTGLETGFMIRVNDCSSVILGIGYRHNILNYELEDFWLDTVKRKFTYNRFSIRLGIVLL